MTGLLIFLGGGVILYVICNVFVQPILNVASVWLPRSTNVIVMFFVNTAYANATAATVDRIATDSASDVHTTLTTVLGILVAALFVSRYFVRITADTPNMEEVNLAGHTPIGLLLGVRFMATVSWLTAAMWILLVLGNFVTHISESVSVEAKASFERSHMALLPYITDTEDRALQGQWARVETKRDYEAIMSDMAGIAADKHAPPLPKREI